MPDDDEEPEEEDEEEEGEEEEDEGAAFVWESSGGCEMCDSMDGREFDTEPYRPHPNCNCTIISRTGMNRDCGNEQLHYVVEHSESVHHASDPDVDDEFDLVYDYEITCFDGEEITGEVVVSATYGEEQGAELEDFMDDMFEDALELVDEIAMMECQNCGAHPHIA
jgi:hypothetical protein